MRIAIFTLLLFLIIGCSVKKETHEFHGIKVYPKKNSTSHPDAKLRLLTKDETVKKGENTFVYEVTSYSLKQNTDPKSTHHLANSHKGQHIHFIVNNGPYQAKYESSFAANLKENSNIVLAFLSRSFHESVKQKDAFVLKQYNFEDSQATIDIQKDPLLFFSRPKGTYKENNNQKVLLDFYLVNTELSKNGNKVKVTLDGHEFTIHKWQPYIIEGLQKGEHKIKIELIDSANKPILSRFNNSGTRKFSIQ